MKKITEESLLKALSYCALPELPKAWDGGSVWIEALAKVVKQNGEESFCLAKRSNGGQYKLVKDFGSTSMIYKVKEYYPFSYLQTNYMPSVETREECISYLMYNRVAEFEELDKKTYEELVNMVVDNAIKLQVYNKETGEKLKEVVKDIEEFNESTNLKNNANGKKRRNKKED
jgi:hypothetical protein